MQLFGRVRRDLSHGCVRVEDPAALAHWVLTDHPGWTLERIQAAMASTPPLRVDLTRPLPVILFYMTAMVMPADQRLYLADDIYGHDTKLVRAPVRRGVLAAFRSNRLPVNYRPPGPHAAGVLIRPQVVQTQRWEIRMSQAAAGPRTLQSAGPSGSTSFFPRGASIDAVHAQALPREPCHDLRSLLSAGAAGTAAGSEVWGGTAVWSSFWTVS